MVLHRAEFDAYMRSNGVTATVFYAVFFYDFGDHEHVFQAPRRWAAKKKAEFLTLSPEEKTIIGEELTPEQAK
ncbi:hypothetical protein H0H87_005025 [Tephrocybe sp. NHM501043]|nr:hypothetical protein H0H87_005025 [Tephrocybe sp. NHM501043]